MDMVKLAHEICFPARTPAVETAPPERPALNATEILQSIADAWAQRLGGKLRVRLHLAVEAGPGAERTYYGATIGDSCAVHWSGFRPSFPEAQAEAERGWQLDGAPKEIADIEKAKLRARCKELGMRIVGD